LTRPLKAADLVRALRAVDSAAVTAAEWRVAQRIADHLAQRQQGAAGAGGGRLDGHIGVAAATHALRDPLETRCRPTPAGCTPRDGDERAFVSAGLEATLLLGPVVAVTHPYIDTRLKYDPDYQGKKDRVIAGRNARAYLSAQWRYAELFFGSLDRNWGFGSLPGLVVSSTPYSYEHVALSLGTAAVRVDGLLAQLDDLPDASGTANHRYFVVRRLVLRPRHGFLVSLWEGTILAGPGRQLEPWYANILNLGLLAQYDQQTFSNNQLGADVQGRIGRTTIFGSLLIDDIQVDNEVPGDDEPTAYAVSLGVRGPAGPASWTAWYTRVANLTYRTPNPAEAVMRRQVGLARNFSDYDQLSLSAGVLAGPDLLLSPEVTLVRQGEGDFRRPYPAVADYDITPVFLAGTVERTVRLALGARLDRDRAGIALDGGVHLVGNAGHVAGATDTRFVARIELTWRFRKESELP
ncbi:MAG TPA: hypothetical protein VGA20_08075, partial [Gemmatimonadales bacterium]